MDGDNLLPIDKECSVGTNRNGSIFWETGIFRGQTSDHYCIEIKGKMCFYLKSNILKLEFSGGVQND